MATALKKAEEELNDNKYLYEKNAIAKNTLRHPGRDLRNWSGIISGWRII